MLTHTSELAVHLIKLTYFNCFQHLPSECTSAIAAHTLRRRPRVGHVIWRRRPISRPPPTHPPTQFNTHTHTHY